MVEGSGRRLCSQSCAGGIIHALVPCTAEKAGRSGAGLCWIRGVVAVKVTEEEWNVGCRTACAFSVCHCQLAH